MVLSDIEKLLKKYDAAETTLEEEQLLKNYFSQDVVAAHLESYKPLFCYFLTSKQDALTKPIALPTKLHFYYKWAAVAAIVLVLLGVYYTNTQDNDLGTYKEPELAFIRFSRSMELISEKFNQGTHTVGYLNKVQTGTSTLKYLNEVDNATRIIFKPTH